MVSAPVRARRQQPAQPHVGVPLTTVLLVGAVAAVPLPVTLRVALAHTVPVVAAIGVFGAGDDAHCPRTTWEKISLPVAPSQKPDDPDPPTLHPSLTHLPHSPLSFQPCQKFSTFQNIPPAPTPILTALHMRCLVFIKPWSHCPGVCWWLPPWEQEDKPLQGRGPGQASPLSHVASSDPSPQLSFPSHCWLFEMHFPLSHLKVSAGQPAKHKAFSRGSKSPWTSAAGSPGSAPRALTALQLVTVVPTVVHIVTDPEEGFAEFVLARELVGSVAFWERRGQQSAGEAQRAREPPHPPPHSSLSASLILGSCLRTRPHTDSRSRHPVSLAMVTDLSTGETLLFLLHGSQGSRQQSGGRELDVYTGEGHSSRPPWAFLPQV